MATLYREAGRCVLHCLAFVWATPHPPRHVGKASVYLYKSAPCMHATTHPCLFVLHTHMLFLLPFHTCRHKHRS